MIPELEGGTFPFLPPERLLRAAVVCHRHADPDSYLSAYAVCHLIRELSPAAHADLIVPDGMSSLTQTLAKSFPYQAPSGEGEYDLLVAVDMGHTELLKDWLAKFKESKGLKVLIDHHPLQPDNPYDRRLVDTSASSAAEVVFSIFKKLGVRPDPTVAQALLTAILFDSQHLAIAGANALRAAVDLIDAGANLEGARVSLRSPPDYGEVVAKLKAARRAKAYRIAGWVVVTTTVGSFQANVARSLVSLGADVAIVAGETSGETRGSLRANQRFKEAAKVHLGTEVAEVVSKGTGHGGGHATAASFTCTLTEDAAVEAALKLVSDLLKEKPVEIK
jgi:nanoRNase/pAp phosphatase (c-di-AMP/oligoRNAs hydrolase)